MPDVDKCPVCGSMKHSKPYDVQVGEICDYDYRGESHDRPVTEEMVSCDKCGVVRVYWIDE